MWGFVLVETLANIRNSARRKFLRTGFGDLKDNSVSDVTVCHVFGTFCRKQSLVHFGGWGNVKCQGLRWRKLKKSKFYVLRTKRQVETS